MGPPSFQARAGVTVPACLSVAVFVKPVDPDALMHLLASLEPARATR